ncbi:hypothetical protein CRG98_006685 [Punica granatum]|uniref:Uncharacterized protein n=1 Tax=Punica granatum TaxID=22663 RepID=A0A2I0KWX8_PUNGR|nr:hypothetical protein CRG98_006685 [Punica granatum]
MAQAKHICAIFWASKNSDVLNGLRANGPRWAHSAAHFGYSHFCFGTSKAQFIRTQTESLFPTAALSSSALTAKATATIAVLSAPGGTRNHLRHPHDLTEMLLTPQ